MASRVVPEIGLTMARFSPKKAFNKLDFPTLGRPIMATLISFSSSISSMAGKN